MDLASERRRLPVVIFDGDDTLWQTEYLYDDARSNAARVVAKAGIDPGDWERLQRAIDVLNVSTMGLSRERFPLSCAQAYVLAAQLVGLPYLGRVGDAVAAAAQAVFETAAPTFPEATTVLEALRVGWRIVLLTQGDTDVQRWRVETSGLAHLFDRIEIVDRKDGSVLRALLERLGAGAADSWMVGNSLRSDIEPAVSCGLRAIWIDAHVWEHERDSQLGEHGLVVVATSLGDVPVLLSAGGLGFRGPSE